VENFLKNLFKKIKLNEPTISTLLGGAVILIVGLLIFNYFKAEQNELVPPEPTIEELGWKTNENGEIVPQNLPEKYTVVANDSLWKISEKYYQTGYNWVDIAEANELVNPHYLEIGQELKLPQVTVRQPKEEMAENEAEVLQPVEREQAITEEKYIVQEGDNLWQISIRAYGDGYQWPKIAQVNNLVYPNFLAVGQELNLPR
jgi:nucleoid-associated protein YgaU